MYINTLNTSTSGKMKDSGELDQSIAVNAVFSNALHISLAKRRSDQLAGDARYTVASEESVRAKNWEHKVL